jgi:hypothetical protein
MIVDMAARIIRYVELDAAGRPVAECFSARIGGDDEEGRFAALVASAALNGHTIVRLCNHEHAPCRNPRLDEVRPDGRGGVILPAGVERWDAATMERAFLPVVDERNAVARMVRFEPGEWSEELKQSDIRVDEGGGIVARFPDGREGVLSA